MDYSKHLNTVNTPVTEALNDRQAANNGGGYSFVIDTFSQVRRFLILGAEGGTYYVGERKLTKDNALCIQRAIKEDAQRLINMIVEVSDNGLAPKNDPAIFALALVASSADVKARKMAYEALNSVVRTSTHLFTFMQAVKNLRGSSKGLRKAVAK